MKLTKYMTMLLISGALFIGCNGGGSEDDASKACDDLCDRYEDCDIDVFDGQVCKPICDEIDDLEGEVSNDCEVALAELFNCAESKSCRELTEDIDPSEIEDALDLIEAIFTDCRDEAEDVADDCEDTIL
jgi:hypothetical protein